MNTGDTAWVMTCAALVFIMTPGVALFYGGLARRKNMLSVLMQCYFIMCLMSLQWVLFGYSLAFGPDVGGFGIIGSLDWVGLRGVGFEPNAGYSGTIPHLVFMIFQAMFAIITPALMVGAFAERIKFSAFVVLMLLWTTLVYDPIAHWVWGGGWLSNLEALDFAGGIVVHVSSGVSALLMAILIGKRLRTNNHGFAPHNLTLTVLGGALLWFGWFGFNAGSALGAGGLAANAFVTTNTATAAAGLTWALIEWRRHGAPTTLGIVTGALAGLVAITPACGFVSPLSSIAIGVIAGMICYVAVTAVKSKFGYDDAFDVFGVHGVGGMWGTLATGLFAEKVINEAGANGLLFGNVKLFLIQGFYLVACIAYALIVTWILYKVVDALFGMRVEKNDELVGLDLTQHHESAYTILE